MKITAIIEKGKDNRFSVYSDAMIGDFGLCGYGDNVDDAKADFEAVIKEAQDDYVREHGELPKKYEQISVTYKYDLMAFFNYFDWINITKFAQEAGINESKMRQYKSGSAFAGERTTSKIQAAVKRLGAELSAAML